MNRFFKMPPQLLRLFLLLIGIVSSYSLARYFLKPPTFGDYGWYRGAALAELRARPLVFGGRKSCEECHSDESTKLAKFAHKNISCESCHGPRQAHAQDPEVKVEKLEVVSFSHCLRCHEANPSRPKSHKQIVSKTHYSGSKCIECHVPHAPSEVP